MLRLFKRKSPELVTTGFEFHKGVFLCIKGYSNGSVLVSNGNESVIIQTKGGQYKRNKKAAIKIALTEHKKLDAAGKFDYLKPLVKLQ